MKSAPGPYRNQRLARPKQRQQHLLEVSIRRDKERARQVRTVVWLACKLILLCALCVGTWVGFREGTRRFLWENPTFFLHDVRVSTDGALTREQILTAASVAEGDHIFRVDLVKVRKALDELPQVEHVEVQRTLPDKLSIEVTERQPIAWLTEKAETDPTAVEGSYMIDARGYVMTSRKLRPEYLLLPIISGVITEDLTPGRKATAVEVTSALELIRLNMDSTRWQVRNIDVSKRYCMVVTDQSHAKVTFGLDDMEKQLNRFYRLLDYIEPMHKEIRTVNMFVQRNTPVTFAEPEPDPADPAAAGAPAGTAAAGSTPAPGAKGKVDAKTSASSGAKAPSATPAPKSGSGDKKSASSSTSKPSSTKKADSSTGSSKKKSGSDLKKPFRANG